MVKKFFDSSHMLMHLIIGFLLAQIMNYFYPQIGMQYLLFPAIIGSFLPDLDHLLYFFTYGKHEQYSKNVRQFLKSGNFIDAARYCANHHKELTGLYSHNIIWVVICLVLALCMGLLSYWWLSLMLLAIVEHFLFDMLEDIILLGKLNKNWLGEMPSL